MGHMWKIYGKYGKYIKIYWKYGGVPLRYGCHFISHAISQPGDCGDDQSLGRDDLVETWEIPEVASMSMFGEEK